MPRSIEAGHQRHTRRRTDTARVGLRELHPCVGKLLHVRRAIAPIEWRDLVVKRDGCILPAHVIDEEDNNVWSFHSEVFVKGTKRLRRNDGQQQQEDMDSHREEFNSLLPRATVQRAALVCRAAAGITSFWRYRPGGRI